MIDLNKHKSTPFGSILTRNREEQDRLLEVSFLVPKNVKAILISSTTGAFIRGLIKSYNLSEEKSMIAAFAILQVVLAEKTLPQLPSLLSTKLRLTSDKAQKMAQEIEKDLFGPIRKELEEFWNQQKKEEPIKQAEERATQGGANNVLNLKKEQSPPAPPWRDNNR